MCVGGGVVCGCVGGGWGVCVECVGGGVDGREDGGDEHRGY